VQGYDQQRNLKQICHEIKHEVHDLHNSYMFQNNKTTSGVIALVKVQHLCEIITTFISTIKMNCHNSVPHASFYLKPYGHVKGQDFPSLVQHRIPKALECPFNS
jgi:hypothetical protein